jgi:hypothetical protein
VLKSALNMRHNNIYLYIVGFLALLTLVIAGVSSSTPVSAAADTCTWTGSGGNSNITTAGNWTGCDNGNVPEGGDNVIFPDGPTNKVVTVNSTTFYASITFSGSSYSVSSAAFESFGATGSTTISGNNNTLNTYLRLYPSTTATFTLGGTGNTIGNAMVIQPTAANTDVVFDINTDVSLPMISQTSVTGSSSIDTFTKTGFGTLDITGQAVVGVTASGGIHIEEGSLECDTENCLGDSANGIYLDNGGDPDGPNLTLNGDDTVPNPITVNTGVGEDASINVGADITFSGAISTSDNLNMFVGGSNTATFSSNLSLGSGTSLALYGSDGYTLNKYIFNGIISGDAGIIVDDAHVTLAGSNTYTGTTELFDTGSGAVVTIKDNNSLGNHGPSAGTIVNPGNSLNFDNAGDVSFEEPITVGGTGVGGSYPGALVKTNQYVSILGGLTVTADTTWHNETSELLTVASVIDGFYDITLTGNHDAGGFGLAPGGENTIGDVIANGIQLVISGANHTAVPENLTMNAVDGKLSRIWLDSNNTVSDLAVITLNNDTTQEAVLISNGSEDTIGTIAGDGLVFMVNANSQFNLGAGDVSGEFTGTVQGYADSMFQIVGGVWTFSGYNTDSGNGFSSFYINGGKFVANAADVSLSMSPFSMSSGVLGGTGQVGPVAVYAGTVSPGNSPGCLYPTGDFAFTDENSFLNVEINGTTACSGYDVLNASGVVYLNDAVLDLEILGDYVSSYGNTFTIVQGSSVTGTFTGLADGGTFSVGLNQFRINYNANSVVLTDVTPAVVTTSLASALAATGSSIYSIIFAALAMGAPATYLALNSRFTRLIHKK